jgi:hypothetical protein
LTLTLAHVTLEDLEDVFRVILELLVVLENFTHEFKKGSGEVSVAVVVEVVHIMSKGKKGLVFKNHFFHVAKHSLKRVSVLVHRGITIENSIVIKANRYLKLSSTLWVRKYCVKVSLILVQKF